MKKATNKQIANIIRRLLADAKCKFHKAGDEPSLEKAPKNIKDFYVYINGSYVGVIVATKLSVAIKHANRIANGTEPGLQDFVAVNQGKNVSKPTAKKATKATPKSDEPKKQRGTGLVAMIDDLIINGDNGKLTSHDIATRVATKFNKSAKSVIKTVRGRPYVLKKNGKLSQDAIPFENGNRGGVSARIRELADGTRTCHEIAEMLAEELNYAIKSAKVIIRSIVFADKKKGLPTTLVSEKQRIKMLTEQLTCQEI